MARLHDNDVPVPENRDGAVGVSDRDPAEQATSKQERVAGISAGIPRDLHKALFSSPSRFIGRFENADVLVAPAFPAFGASPQVSASTFQTGPWHRSFGAIVFRADDEVPIGETTRHMPDYSHIVAQVLAGLSVFFGKQLDDHGLVESHGRMQPPQALPTEPNILPFSAYSDKPRADVDVELNFEKAGPILDVFSNEIDPVLYDTFMTGARLYARSLRTCQREPEAAYIDLVLCGEVLSQYREFENDDLYDEELKEVMTRLERAGAEQRDLQFLKGRLRQVKRRYVVTLRDLLNDRFFARSESRIDRLRLTADNIEQTLAASYDLRSRYVHRGGSLHGFVMPAINHSELPTVIPSVEDKSLKKVLWRAPTFAGLERVIRFCLLRLLHVNGVRIHDALD